MRQQQAAELATAIAVEGVTLTSGEFARRAGVTRQAAHKQLQRLEEAGLLVRKGAGRSSRFDLTRTPLALWSFEREGLDEADVWKRVDGIEVIHGLPRNVRSLLRHALTEVVNNAIDHSSGQRVTIALDRRSDDLSLTVTDDGVGIFRHVSETRALTSEREAIAVLQTGKETTDPERHAGEGLFFVSRMGDVVSIESGRTRWVTDSLRQDTSVQDIRERPGTRVSWSVDVNTSRTTQEVFGRFTDVELNFSKTEALIRLLQQGNEFVSRSEARRLGEQLAKFGSVTLDFAGVSGVGQGFVDELFRVWQRAHPSVEITTVNMNSAVRLMIGRVRRELNLQPSPARVSLAPLTPTVIVRVGTTPETDSTTGDGGSWV